MPMRPEEVPDAWWQTIDDVFAREGAGKRGIRIALAAVIPAIQAEALDRAAGVADGAPYHGRYRTWPWWSNPDGSQGNRENESDVVRHADKIAAAIRALKEGT